MDEDRAAQVIEVEGLGEACETDHGVFEALGFVDGREQHAAARAVREHQPRLPKAAQGAGKGDEVAAVPGVIRHEGAQRLDVRAPGRAAGHGPEDLRRVRLL